MSRIYCEITDVKRLLRSVANRESKIRFSDAYRDLKADSGNTGTIALSGVTFVDVYAEHETFTFEFTDSTSFDVSGDVVGNIGSGNRFDAFIAEERFSVPVANWSGAALEGDKYYITSASDVSEDDGHEYIVDATRRINSRLERIFGTLDNVSYYDSTNVELPQAVEFACIRYTAYDIFNSVYAGIAPPGEDSPVEGWKVSAEDTLGEYLSGHGKGPIWKSREARVEEIGVEGVEGGIIEIDELSDAKNKQYER